MIKLRSQTQTQSSMAANTRRKVEDENESCCTNQEGALAELENGLCLKREGAKGAVQVNSFNFEFVPDWLTT